ncbi:MAG: dihydropteroate synthase [Zoogloeaceae bacterium]|nr:dihydropteroate synthase [Zoogloeaceae bacterium]
MAIINLTPDSFSGDGLAGKHPDEVLRRAETAVRDGAAILDIGGESTRPGAPSIGEAEELDRILPVLERLGPLGVPVSVDTNKPAVMRAAMAAGASLINDVNALRAEGALEAVASSAAAVCLMHMQGDPRTMQQAPAYDDVVAEVGAFLAHRVAVALSAGIERQRIVVDPGFGFGKSVEHNWTLMRRLDFLGRNGLPVLVGISRKSMLGAVTGRSVPDRMAASLAAALMAVERGARIVRVHDVAATRDVLRVWEAMQEVPPRS